MLFKLNCILLFSFSLVSPFTHACTCAAPRIDFKSMRALAEAQLEKSAVLFEGRVEQIELQYGVASPIPSGVLSVTPSLTVLKVTMRATRVYRGSAKDIMTVMTGTGAGDCGFAFEIGKSYLVDASEDVSGHLSTSICHATRELELAGAYQRILQRQPPTSDDLLSPKEYWEKNTSRSDGKICGFITHQDGTRLTKSLTGTLWRVLNSPVTPPKYGDLNISPNGSFCTDPIPTGRYIVGADDGEPLDTGVEYRGYYPGLPHDSQHDFIEVRPEENVSNAIIVLRRVQVYTLRGRVVAVGGNLKPSEELRILLQSSDDLLADPEDTAIESDGTFEFNQVPPGHYSIFVAQYAGMNGRPKWSPSRLDIVVPKQTDGIVLTIARVH